MSSESIAELYEPLLGDPAVAALLSARATVQTMLDVEVALAEAEASAAVIPHSCVDKIRTAAVIDRFDLTALAAEAAQAGNLAIPLIEHLTRQVALEDGDAARFVHWGATSQDVLDTALVLQLQAAVPVIAENLRRAAMAAATHARDHIDTIMPGRTLLQQATPTTFGLKAAGWCDALHRQRASIGRALEDSRFLQLGGASGTLAALGTDGPAVEARLAERLRLRVADVPWHTHRDRLVSLSCALGVAAGVCGKIARDIALLGQTEVGEASETRSAGGGSSTMPHKRNPVWSCVALAASVRTPGLVSTLLQAMPQEHERGLGGWQAEWVALPDLVRATAGASRALAHAVEGLAIDQQRMQQNVGLTRGLIMSEALSMALAARVGRRQAHGIVESAFRAADATGTTFLEALLATPEVRAYFTAVELEQHLSPAHYLGSARTFVERVLRRSRAAS